MKPRLPVTRQTFLLPEERRTYPTPTTYAHVGLDTETNFVIGTETNLIQRGGND